MNPPPFTYAWRAVTDQVLARRTQGDTLFTWEYLPAIYFHTRMESPSRNLDARHLDVWPEKVNEAQSNKIWLELWPGIVENPPRFVVDKVKSPQQIQEGGSFYKQFRDFVDSHYTLIYENYGHRLYERVLKINDL